VTDFAGLIGALVDSKVRFILIGGVAATVHGSSRLTRDVDVVYDRQPENIERLIQALSPHHPVLRDAPAGLPFRFDRMTVAAGLNFTLKTDLGDLDVFGEIAGGGTYSNLLPQTISIEVFGRRCDCLSIDQLIAVKRAAGRPRDVEAVAELELIRERTRTS
jgi:predicted nucleotidyltransferase